MRLSPSAKVREDHHDQVGGKPNVVIAHVLVDVDQYQDARSKYPKQQIGQLRHTVRREQVREQKQIHQHHDPRCKKRKQQKIKVHLTARIFSARFGVKGK